MLSSQAYRFARRMLPATALIVQPDPPTRAFVTSTLNATGFRVVTSDFDEARFVLDIEPPALLVTDIRLDRYNGIYLAMRGKRMKPRLSIVLTSPYEDAVLQQEIERLDGTFVVMPVAAEDFVAAIARTILRSRKKDVDPVRPPFDRRVSDRRRETDAALRADRRTGTRRLGLAWQEVLAGIMTT